jgi:CDP-paratose 2-epimerase
MKRHDDRLEAISSPDRIGLSDDGIAETFPLAGARSLYGATKLASELLIEEYRSMYGLRSLINRCGVIAGPWQMGKVDQGFVVLWVARHLFGGPLSYTGFGGEGLQVRDILHIDDLFDLLVQQIRDFAALDGSVFNVGGGRGVSASLREMTRHCFDITGHSIEIGQVPDTRPADIPWYISDHRLVTKATGWKPKRNVATIVTDIHQWLSKNRKQLEPILAS